MAALLVNAQSMKNNLEHLPDEAIAAELARRGFCGTIRNKDGKTLDLSNLPLQEKAADL